MATIKEAVASAVNFAEETLGPERASGLQLEEVESGSFAGQEAWLITLSMSSRNPVLATLSAAREYKVFTVLKATGEVVAMKIRELVT
jgi:hypothetical protein